MPSTYSPDLRIELIANGEKTGTWGTITNDNLGVIIEDAISGLVTYTTGVQKYALTAQNGAADQARCAALAINTAYAGNFEIYVPPVTKLYVFKNTDTTYDATVYCSDSLGSTTPPPGGTGVTVPPGKSVLLRADGTDVVEQLNHVVDNMSFGGNVSVAGNAAVTGNLTVTGTTSLADELLLNGSSGTAGQVLVSQGAGTYPTWGNAFVPGMIMMWSGTIATIPTGWLLCDGTSGTPDLRNNFVIGAYSDDAGQAKTTITGSPTKTGGSKDAITVSHTHTATSTAVDSGHAHPLTITGIGAGGGSGEFVGTNGAPAPSSANNRVLTGTANVTVTTTVASAGSSGTNANLVPYYALAFIMKS